MDQPTCVFVINGQPLGPRICEREGCGEWAVTSYQEVQLPYVTGMPLRMARDIATWKLQQDPLRYTHFVCTPHHPMTA